MRLERVETYFAGYFALELNPGTLVDEAQVLEYAYALFVVGQQLQVLIRHELPKRVDVLFDEPLIMFQLEMLQKIWAF